MDFTTLAVIGRAGIYARNRGEVEKKRLTAFLAVQTLAHEGTKQRAREQCDSAVALADFAIQTLEDHVERQIAALDAAADAHA